jgi:hypothetical protein
VYETENPSDKHQGELFSATHKEEESSEKFHLDRVSNKSEIGVSIKK